MGPRRTTLSYSSEDAPVLKDTHKIYVYYCKYSGKHVLTTDCNLNTAPRRRTDHALVIDTDKYTAKLYATEGPVKFLKRRSGAIERQYRIQIGKLPIGYRTEPEGRYLYILDDALTTYSTDEGMAGGTGGGDKAPVPPCITATAQGSQVALEIEDRGNRPMVLKITADSVRMQIKNNIHNAAAVEELLDFMRNVLGVRLSQMQLLRGDSPRNKTLLVDGMSKEALFEKLQKAVHVLRSRYADKRRVR